MPQPTNADQLRRWFALTLGTDPAAYAAQLAAAEQRRTLHRVLAERLGARDSLTKFVPLFSKTQPYLMGWFHRELCELLDDFVEAVELGKSPRLMIFAPPRHGKSEITSRCLPPFLLGRHPNWEITAATYNQEFANDWGRDTRAIVTDPIFRDLFPNFEIMKGQNSVDRFATTARGVYRTVGRATTLTGTGCKVLIIDDPLKGRAEADSDVERQALHRWYDADARTRVENGGGIILVQTRWHELDLAGHLLDIAKANPAADQWLVYEFPALATEDEPHRQAGEALHPDRWPVSALRKLEASLDSREWTALFQQRPVPPSGIHFKREWLDGHWNEYPPPPANVNWYISTDFAISTKESADFTVLQPFAIDEHQNIYFAAPIRGHFSSNEIVENLCDLMDTYRPVQVAIENVHISKTLGPYLRKRMDERGLYTPLWSFTAHKDKLARSTSLRGRMQQSKVNCSPTTRATVEPELLSFPAGRHDDIVDAMSVACLMLDELVAAAPPPAPLEPPVPMWSYEWIRERTPDHSTDARAHVPRHLNGRERKPRQPKTWSTTR